MTMTRTTPEQNKALVLEAFNTLFNKRDYDAASRFWSDKYIQHSAHIEPGRDGLFRLIRSLPDSLHYEHGLILAEADYVIVHGRFSGHGQPAAWVAADLVRIENGVLAELGTYSRTRRPKRNRRADCPRSAIAFPDDETMGSLSAPSKAGPTLSRSYRNTVSPSRPFPSNRPVPSQ
jgi:predicted SnoaL-like aldol condensation-catalyzing enzyme